MTDHPDSLEAQVWALRQRSEVLEAVCAVLLAKMALLTPDPARFIHSASAQFLGGMVAVADAAPGANSTVEATAAMERICRGAEDLLPPSAQPETD